MKNNLIYSDTDINSSLDRLKLLVVKRYSDRQPLCFLHSFGCQQNVSDGEKIKEMLSRAGYGFTNALDDADLIIYNTCAIRENAEDRVFGTIGNLKHIKNAKPDTVIGICGCMAQQDEIAEKIKNTYKQVDLVFGTYAYINLYNMLSDILEKRIRVFDLSLSDGVISEEFTQLRDDNVRATVPIMYGCNNFCTYCIVPYVRGRERSRSVDSVVNEVRGLVSRGYREITLLGQNVNSYSFGFPELLKEIDKIDGRYRIRFVSSHPKDATKELIDVIVNSKHISKQLHLPVQAGSDRILSLMNRKYSVNSYLEIIDYARSIYKDFCFSTDLIVGFPSETYEEFCETKELIKRVEYYNIFSYVYSMRKGTKASEMSDNISVKDKGLWLRELILEQRETAQTINKRFIGKTLEVLVDRLSESNSNHLIGKADEGIIVEFEGTADLIGEFVNVEIINAMNWAVLGKLACNII